VTSNNLEQISSLYNTYNEVIKPLIALYEAREEQFPTPVFNEIRAFNDHIAKCHLKKIDENQINEEIKLAERHIFRIIFDCYKFLNVSFHKEINIFENETRNIDLTLIDNGEFYPNFKRLKNSAIQYVRTAKKNESFDIQKSFTNYENAFNAYSEIVELISHKKTDVNWARKKHSLKKILKFVLWILSALLSGLVSLFFTCESIKNLILSFF
jgi:hypothetical protein